MKKLIIGIGLGLVLGYAVAAWMARSHSAPAADSGPAVAQAAAGPAEGPLHLSADQQKAAGITVVTPRQLALAPEVDAYGRVLDPTPYVTLVAEEATAKASLAASEKELQRVRKLNAAGGNASAQAVETAEAAAIRDRAAVASAHIRLLAGWGITLAEHADLATLRATLAKGAALLRIDLLPGVSIDEMAPRARVTLLGASESYDVEILGPAPVADAQVQGASLLALLRDHSLPAGATLRARVRGTGQPAPALVVPRSALVYHQGSAWAYVAGKSGFERRLVTPGQSLGDDVVIASGLGSDDRVVAFGAEQLLSTELSSGASTDER